MTHLISTFQPLGDAASELRAIVPGIDHMTAVSVLRDAEDYGRVTDHDVTVTFKRYEGWTVDAP